jgi:photosystem II stability/assembly factor-like uncharacterized protein
MEELKTEIKKLGDEISEIKSEETIHNFELSQKITKTQLEKNIHNFVLGQKINNSEILTFDSVPSTIPIFDTGDYSNLSLNWENRSDMTANSISSSYDGTFQILASKTGGLYLSLDSGHNFILIDDFQINDVIFDNSVIYSNVSISSNGIYLLASCPLGIISSPDFGSTWNLNNITSLVYSTCMSSDGKIQYIGTELGIYVSKNYGFEFKLLNRTCNFICCSSNAQFVSAFKKNVACNIFYSNDYGVTLKISNSPIKTWVSLKCSFTGQYQTAISGDFLVFISSDYGINWIQSDTHFYEPFTDLTISASGKYQLISGEQIHTSKDHGRSWRSKELNGQIDCVSISSNGKIAILSSDEIYISLIEDNYIQECGSDVFTPLDQSLFATSWSSLENEYSGEYKLSASVSGKYQSICFNSGSIIRSDDFGVSFTSSIIDEPKQWNSIAVSSSGQFQTAIVKDEAVIYRSDDYGVLFVRVGQQFGFNLNDIKLSNSGKYQTIVGDGGNVIYSLDYGYTWVSSTVCASNLVSITMSGDGKYQTFCGINDSNNSVMYSKTYGVNWKYSNFTDSSIEWKNVSCSDDGQYQTLCGANQPIFISEDYGINWNQSLSGDSEWIIVYVSSFGQKQIAHNYNGNIYVSLDFGFTWNQCYDTINMWKSLIITKTLQYVIGISDGTSIVSKIEGSIPGRLTINTRQEINEHAVILLSGSNLNKYSYETNCSKSFDIISSDFEDNSAISYAILYYGQTVN